MTKESEDKSIKTEKAMSNTAKNKQHEKEVQKKNHTLDKVKFIFAIIILFIGIAVYYVIPKTSSLYNFKALFPIVGIIIASVIVLFWCTFGKNLINYIRESTQEMYKVVWPDKPTALRITITVIIFVTILSVFMFASDSLISYVFFDILFKRG